MTDGSRSQSARTVLVTGAARGIGLACAKRFARSGDTVILADIDIAACEREAAALGAPHFALRMDVGSEDSIREAIRSAIARDGRIDILVNNAGIVDSQARPLLNVPAPDIRRLIDINLNGSFVAAREAGRHMATNGGGAVVNIASGAALRAIPGRAAYSMTKAAILGLTRALASEWAGSGIRVNAVLPGYVMTEILAALEREGRFDPRVVASAVPLGRLGTAEEVAETVYQVAGSTYVTGASISVDGGVDAFGAPTAAASGPAPRFDAAPSQVACVTGGASGIGAAIGRRLADKDYRVIILDKDEAALAKIGPGQVGIALDVTDEQAVDRCFDEISARYGPVAMLVNNAAIVDPLSPTLEQHLPDFQCVIDVDLMATLFASRAAAKQMIAAGGGAIVNLSSIVAAGGMPMRNAYCAAKAGVSMLTKSLACEWAQHGIRVNAVAPGYILTPAVEALMKKGERNLDAVRRRIPMGRLGTPDEIAEIVAFLLSGAASYMTGTIYAADGGYAAYGAPEAASGGD